MSKSYTMDELISGYFEKQLLKLTKFLCRNSHFVTD